MTIFAIKFSTDKKSYISYKIGKFWIHRSKEKEQQSGVSNRAHVGAEKPLKWLRKITKYNHLYHKITAIWRIICDFCLRFFYEYSKITNIIKL